MASEYPRLRGIDGQGITHRHYRYPTGTPRNQLVLSGEVIADNHNRCVEDMLLFKENVRWVAWKRGYSLTQVCRELNEHGVKVRRSTLLEKDLRRYPSVLYVSTFARVLGVPTWMLLHPEIEQVFQA